MRPRKKRGGMRRCPTETMNGKSILDAEECKDLLGKRYTEMYQRFLTDGNVTEIAEFLKDVRKRNLIAAYLRSSSLKCNPLLENLQVHISNSGNCESSVTPKTSIEDLRASLAECANDKGKMCYNYFMKNLEYISDPKVEFQIVLGASEHIKQVLSDVELREYLAAYLQSRKQAGDLVVQKLGEIAQRLIALSEAVQRKNTISVKIYKSHSGSSSDLITNINKLFDEFDQQALALKVIAMSQKGTHDDKWLDGLNAILRQVEAKYIRIREVLEGALRVVVRVRRDKNEQEFNSNRSNDSLFLESNSTRRLIENKQLMLVNAEDSKQNTNFVVTNSSVSRDLVEQIEEINGKSEFFKYITDDDPSPSAPSFDISKRIDSGNFAQVYNGIYDDKTNTNKAIYDNDVREYMSECIASGKNVVLFGYGFSGSGKTYTLIGDISNASTYKDMKDPGLVFHFWEHMSNADNISLDLIAIEEVSAAKLFYNRESTKETKLQSFYNFYPLDQDPEYPDVNRVQNEDMLLQQLKDVEDRRAHETLTTKFTPNNKTSSRSHLLIKFIVNRKSVVTFIDMAGLENVTFIQHKIFQTRENSVSTLVSDASFKSRVDALEGIFQSTSKGNDAFRADAEKLKLVQAPDNDKSLFDHLTQLYNDVWSRTQKHYRDQTNKGVKVDKMIPSAFENLYYSLGAGKWDYKQNFRTRTIQPSVKEATKPKAQFFYFYIMMMLREGEFINFSVTQLLQFFKERQTLTQGKVSQDVYNSTIKKQLQDGAKQFVGPSLISEMLSYKLSRPQQQNISSRQRSAAPQRSPDPNDSFSATYKDTVFLLVCAIRREKQSICQTLRALQYAEQMSSAANIHTQAGGSSRRRKVKLVV